MPEYTLKLDINHHLKPLGTTILRTSLHGGDGDVAATFLLSHGQINDAGVSAGPLFSMTSAGTVGLRRFRVSGFAKFRGSCFLGLQPPPPIQSLHRTYLQMLTGLELRVGASGLPSPQRLCFATLGPDP